ncbi:MAG TPA: pitrilysin family protein [Gemmatimonadales bacterium]|nr:pitrilysin family protein [Gemmatimonadales bacterium]
MSAARTRRLAWLPVCAALWGTTGRPAGPPGPARPRSGVEPDTLTTAYDASGVHVIQRIVPGSDVVAVRLYLLGGTSQLTARTAGIEALWLHASEYGTAQFPGDEAAHVMARTGSDVFIEPELDWTVFGFTALAEQMDTTWRVFADRLTHPSLTDAAVAQARGALVSWAHRRYTQPDLRVQRIAMQALFQDHPYAIDPEGTEESLGTLSPADVRTYAREHFVTSRLLLVVVGGASRSRIDSLVTGSFGLLPRGDYRWTPPPAPVTPRGVRWLLDNRPLPTTYLLGYFTGPPTTSSRYWAFRVATALLSSRLNYAIRVDRSLSYAAFAPYLDQAIPVGGAYVSTPKPDVVVPLVVQQIEGLESQPLDKYVLARFVDSFGFDYLAENSDSPSQADFLARAELYLGGYRRGEEFVRRMHGVAPGDVMNIAKDYMTHIQYAYLGDTSRMHGNW